MVMLGYGKYENKHVQSVILSEATLMMGLHTVLETGGHRVQARSRAGDVFLYLFSRERTSVRLFNYRGGIICANEGNVDEATKGLRATKI